MPKLKNQYPKNCRDRNQAFSWHNGKRIYHGIWGTPEAKKSYDRFIAALLENPALPLRDGKTGDVFVSELVAGFVDYIETRLDRTELLHFNRFVLFELKKGSDKKIVIQAISYRQDILKNFEKVYLGAMSKCTEDLPKHNQIDRKTHAVERQADSRFCASPGGVYVCDEHL